MVNLTNAECDAIAREVQRTMYGTDDYDVLNADYERALIRAGAATVPREPTIREAVDRFLAWPLPAAFAPDGGIRFDGRMSRVTGPTGTNLFTAEQARAMFEHCLAAPKGPEARPVACRYIEGAKCPNCSMAAVFVYETEDLPVKYCEHCKEEWEDAETFAARDKAMRIAARAGCAAPQAEGTKRSTDDGGQLGEDAGRAASDSRQPAPIEQTLPPPSTQQPPARERCNAPIDRHLTSFFCARVKGHRGDHSQYPQPTFDDPPAQQPPASGQEDAPKPSNDRNGNFLDADWCCKVCDGEIPDGHAEACYIWQLEKKHRNFIADVYSPLFKERDALAARLAQAEKEQKHLIAACDIHIARNDTLRAELERERRVVHEVCAALPCSRFMDPPDGGDVPIGEQVRRMCMALESAEAELERTRAALRTFTDFASRLHTMSDEELEAWRKAAHAAARRALEGGS